jgi:RNA polymerase sigma-70 factor (ECF subfamily)
LPGCGYSSKKEIVSFFYQDFYHVVFQTACFYTHDIHLAQDVVQETFCKALQNFEQLRDQLKVKFWLTRIAANTARDFLRSSARCTATAELDFICRATNEYSLEDKVIKKETALAVWQLVEQIPLQLCQAFLLRYKDNLSLEEISTALNIPVGTVKSRLYRARNRLSKKFTL